MSTETKAINISICSHNAPEAIQIVEAEISLCGGEVVRTISRQYMPKVMRHTDAVIQAKILVPSLILPRRAHMGAWMGKLNARIPGICWYTWNNGSSSTTTSS